VVKKIIFLIFVLFCFIACSNSKIENNKSKQQMKKQEDNFKKFLLKGLDSGKKVWELKGDTAVFSMDNPEEVNIQNPDIYFYDKKDPSKLSATVKAVQALVNTKTKDMHAIGKVEMFSEKENAKLFSEEVFYRNSDAIFYSDKAVRVERDDSITEGIGFDAKSDLSVINIKKNVSINYRSTDTVKGV
jgi:LPS export ABC transporter protein LptC